MGWENDQTLQTMVKDSLIELLQPASKTGLAIPLSSLETTLETALDYIPDMVFIKDRHFTMRLVNQAFCDKTGIPRQEVIGKTAAELFEPDLAQSFQESDEEILSSGKPVRSEVWLSRRRSQSRYLLDSMKIPIFDSHNVFQGVFAVCRDITQQKQREMERDSLISSLRDTLEMLQKQSEALKTINEQLNDMAITDALTQVANRRFFERQYDIEWRRCRREKSPLAILLIDVDQFKLFNDNFGHTAGDECLRRVANVLSKQIGRPGDILARFGGEEFVAILPNTKDHLAEVAKRCLAAVQKEKIPHAKSAYHPVVTISIGGIVGYPHHLESPLELLDLADQHLYLAKQRGRNTYTLMES
ncbi:sensor domain-containing diguanylate cyclase [Hahella ganghwensis]|uniref:sensor domain-containing diguanylate cyclase n=1 Tax=Hahella ganghwensis TaxID=286420 RepID=UPI00035F1ACC|nr:GGDEF domain-containing protein [Hahella ganghwensis]